MSGIVKLRFAVAILLAWMLGGVAAWVAPLPGGGLVGQRQGAAVMDPADDAGMPDIAAARSVLESAVLWGVQRDGKPFPPPVKAEELQKKVEWRLVGWAIRPKERYILIRISGAAPVTVKEGDALPDGGRLVKIMPKELVVRTAEGKKQRMPTFSW